jgi:DUF1680 family protein
LAWYRATGNRNLLDAATRFASYVVENFGPAPKRPFVTGHPELEMAMVELYRTEGDARYLEFARYLFSGVDRERLKLKDSEIRYMFSGKPFTSRTEFEGHAVRALYAASGATDYFSESGNPEFKKTLDVLWKDLTTRKMYITGGVGARASGESFGDPYDLPSEQAYAETCAAVANVMWNFRMLAITGQASYTDVLERALYNGANSGVSLAGTLYCYRNPLAWNGSAALRNPWYDTTCCPPNIERLFESLPGYFYATSRSGLYVHLYGSSDLNWHLEGGTAIHLSQASAYPWSGDIRFAVDPQTAADFTLYLRWPGWAPSIDISVNGQPFPVKGDKGSYVALTRTWHKGDTVTLTLPMPPLQMVSNPRVADTYGRIALQRGPLVYALEQLDQGGAALGDLTIRPFSSSTPEMRKETLGGVVVLKSQGAVAERSTGEEPLYQPLVSAAGRLRRPVSLTFIPFYAVGNREPSPMEVWVPAGRLENTGVAPGSAPSLERRSDSK